MFLAFVELFGRGSETDRFSRCSSPRSAPPPSRIVQLQFPQLETARIWAREESSRHVDATGNAVVFQTAGPFMSVVWECEAGSTVSQGEEVPVFLADEIIERA